MNGEHPEPIMVEPGMHCYELVQELVALEREAAHLWERTYACGCKDKCLINDGRWMGLLVFCEQGNTDYPQDPNKLRNRQ